jgi:hypothetical protein
VCLHDGFKVEREAVPYREFSTGAPCNQPAAIRRPLLHLSIGLTRTVMTLTGHRTLLVLVCTKRVHTLCTGVSCKCDGGSIYPHHPPTKDLLP